MDRGEEVNGAHFCLVLSSPSFLSLIGFYLVPNFDRVALTQPIAIIALRGITAACDRNGTGEGLFDGFECLDPYNTAGIFVIHGAAPHEWDLDGYDDDYNDADRGYGEW
jgi:hypothetical protein